MYYPRVHPFFADNGKYYYSRFVYIVYNIHTHIYRHLRIIYDVLYFSTGHRLLSYCFILFLYTRISYYIIIRSIVRRRVDCFIVFPGSCFFFFFFCYPHVHAKHNDYNMTADCIFYIGSNQLIFFKGHFRGSGSVPENCF